MTDNLIMQIAGITVPTGADKVERDEMIVDGVLGRWDFSNTYCLDPTDTPINGLAIPNLVFGAPDATLVMASGASVTFTGGGIKFNDTTASKIELDDGTYYLTSDLDDDYLMIVWAKLPSGSATTQYIMSKIAGAFTNPGVFIAAQNNASLTFNGKFSDSSAGSDVSVGSITSPTVPTQLAVARIGGIVNLYKDGAFLSKGSSAPTALTSNASKLILGRAGSGSLVANTQLYLGHIENLTTSGRAADETVYNDYAQCASLFT